MITYKFVDSANRKLSIRAFEALRDDIREVAEDCLGEVPYYQIFSDNQRVDVVNMVVIAYKDRIPLGFTSALVFNMKDYKVLHLGLTCVKKEYRGNKISQALCAKLLFGYILRHAWFKKIWISNIACVLSSLGNVAKYFDEVYPSPQYQVCPSIQHFSIAQEISINYRNEIYVPSTANFDDDKNVFKNSVKETIFEKSENDYEFYHRNSLYNIFYKKLIDFSTGDEVLQIGRTSLWSILTKSLAKSVKKIVITWHTSKEGEIQEA